MTEAFREKQRFSPVLLGIVGVVLVLFGWALPFESLDSAAARWAWLGLALPLIAIVLLYSHFPLVTEVSDDTVRFGFPLRLRMSIAKSEIASTEVIEYRPIRDFGGWGFRFGRGGKMFNARGNRAVKLTLKDGRTVFVGSQEPERLAAAIGVAQTWSSRTP